MMKNEELLDTPPTEAALKRLVEELRSKADTASRVSREMAEAKSLRQEGNRDRRTDLYMWPMPDETLEGRAASAIEALSAPTEAALDVSDRAREAAYAFTETGWVKGSDGIGLLAEAFARFERDLLANRALVEAFYDHWKGAGAWKRLSAYQQEPLRRAMDAALSTAAIQDDRGDVVHGVGGE